MGTMQSVVVTSANYEMLTSRIPIVDSIQAGDIL